MNMFILTDKTYKHPRGIM